MFKALFSLFKKDKDISLVNEKETSLVEAFPVNDIVLSEEDIYRFIKIEVDNRIQKAGGGVEDLNIDDFENLLPEAARLVVIHQQASTSLLQRKMKLGYSRAGRIMDQLENLGVVGAFTGSRAREVMFGDLKGLEGHFRSMGVGDNSSKLKHSFFEKNMLHLYEDVIVAKVDLYFKDLEEKERQREIEEITTDILRKDRLKKEKMRILEQRRQIEKELSEQGLISVVPGYRRDPISQEVKDQVWNRDQGKCVECGRSEKLEFDHIIPLSKGGANTYRNLQLLCEECNRRKSNRIG